MKLGSFFKEDIAHADAEVRCRAVGELEAGDPRLDSLASEDPDATVRSAAVSRLRDMSRVHSIAASDDISNVRTAADARLQALVAGENDVPQELAVREGWLRGHATPALAQYVARHAREPELRMVALALSVDLLPERQTQSLVASMASTDSSADVRLAAAGYVVEPEQLEQLLSASKGHDKRVHRVVRERLQKARELRQRNENLSRLCDVAQALADNPDADVLIDVSLGARLQVLENDWQQALQGHEPDTALAQRFAATTQIIRKEASARQVQADTQAGLLEQLRLLEGRPGDSDIPASLAGLREQWQALSAPTESQTRAFEAAARQLSAHHANAARDAGRASAIVKVLDKFDSRANRDGLVAPGLLKDLEKQWGRLTQPVNKELVEELAARYLALHDSLRDHVKKQKTELASSAQSLETLLGQLATSLEAGKLQQSISLYDKTRSRLSSASLDAGRQKALDKRMQGYASKIADLKRWRHWGTDKAREKLIESAQALIGVRRKLATIAQEVRALRDEWKKLDRTDGLARQELWQRFNDACEKAYAPCKEHFDRQAAGRSDNLANRTALCDRLTVLAENTDWAAPDWRGITKIVRDTRREYHAVGPVDRKARKAIEEKFRQANAAVEEHLDAERERELLRRRGLIRKVQALAQEHDLNTAIAAAQQAQREWSPTVQASRTDEQSLWEEFRAACDAVFERRRQTQAAVSEEAAAQAKQRDLVCSGIRELADNLAALTPDDVDYDAHLNQLVGQYESALAQWQPGGHDPRRKGPPANKRFSDVCRSFDKALNEKRAIGEMRERKILDDKASLCDTLEQVLLTSADSQDVSTVRTECEETWQRLPHTRGAVGKALQTRFDRALAASGGDEEAGAALVASCEANLAERRRIALALEIAADIESPPEFAKARMEHRVAQLSAALASGGQNNDTQQQWRELVDAWFATGPVLPVHNEELQARFVKAQAALEAGR